ncbi:MAG: hypothetical protein AB8F95_04995 [Bacteroidia bacterium]
MMKGRLNTYTSRYYELTQYGKKHGLLFSKNNCRPSLFINNVTIASRSSNMGWFQELHDDWLPHVVKAHRPKCKLYWKAMKAFIEKDFASSYTYFSSFQQENHDDLLEIKVRIRMLACSYELDKDGIDSRIEADERYLYRKDSVGERYRQNGKRFISKLKQIRKLMPGNEAKLAQLQKAILEEPGALASWLLQKSDEAFENKTGPIYEYEKRLSKWGDGNPDDANLSQ